MEERRNFVRVYLGNRLGDKQHNMVDPIFCILELYTYSLEERNSSRFCSLCSLHPPTSLEE